MTCRKERSKGEVIYSRLYLTDVDKAEKVDHKDDHITQVLEEVQELLEDKHIITAGLECQKVCELYQSLRPATSEVLKCIIHNISILQQKDCGPFSSNKHYKTNCLKLILCVSY